MHTIQDVLKTLERIAPERLAYGFDHVGLQVGARNTHFSRALVSLDASPGAIEEARAEGAQLIVSHHPIIWDPLPSLTGQNRPQRSVADLVLNGIAVIAAHTNWDCAVGGVSDTLATRLGLKEVQQFGSFAEHQSLKLVVYVPPGSREGLIDALSAAGAGVIGDYTRCAFYSSGTGTFVAGEGSNPAVGRRGVAETVEEDRLEMVLPKDAADEVVHALRTAHPYEEPAYDLIPLLPRAEARVGRIGMLEAPMEPRAFCEHVNTALGTNSTRWIPSEPRMVQRIAVVGGAGDDEWSAAIRAGADAFLTGEVRHHIALDATSEGISVLAAGHYATEQPGVEALASALREALPEAEWRLYTPPPGQHGRPA